MRNLFLVCSMDSREFRDLASRHLKVDDFDCRSQVVVVYACKEYASAVRCCREENRIPYNHSLRYFVKVVHEYE